MVSGISFIEYQYSCGRASLLSGIQRGGMGGCYSLPRQGLHGVMPAQCVCPSITVAPMPNPCTAGSNAICVTVRMKQTHVLTRLPGAQDATSVNSCHWVECNYPHQHTYNYGFTASAMTSSYPCLK